RIECLDDFVLALLHFREIDPRAVNHDAMLRRLLFDEHEMIARSQKRFARDAAHVQAGAAQFLAFLDERGLQSKLARTNRSDISAGTRANDHDIKFFHSEMSNRRKLRSRNSSLRLLINTVLQLGVIRAPMDPAVSTAFSCSLPDEAVETADDFALRSTWLKPGVNETSGKRAEVKNPAAIFSDLRCIP